MLRNLVIIGAGEYWRKLVMPSLNHLQNAGLVGEVTSVDTQDVQNLDVRHVIRDPSDPLSQVVDSLGYTEPIVILAHPNHLHTPEAVELLENSNGNPGVLLEKPYAVNPSQLADLEDLVSSKRGNIGLLEYYLTMKVAPLLLFGGLIKEDSFYFEDNGILKSPQGQLQLRRLSGRLLEKIGDPLFVLSEVLEGEGSFGTIEHRNLSIVDNEQGGGMIQDIGQHLIAPLVALEGYLGAIGKGAIRDVRTAFCSSYLEFARQHLPLERIGESYAEIDLETSKGVPVKLALGKYVENGTNQRRIVVTGTRGTVLYDMTNNILSFQQGDDNRRTTPLVEADKVGMPKYLAVLRAGIETLEGKNPFTFDPVSVAFNAQDLVMAALDMKNKSHKKTLYEQGAMHDSIF